MSDQNVQGVNASKAGKSSQAYNLEQSQELEAEQTAAEIVLVDAAEDAVFSPMYVQRDNEKLEEKTLKHKTGESEEAEEDDDVDMQLVDDVTKLARSYEKKNPVEMNHKALLGLKADINEGDDAETILKKVRTYYKRDNFLADEALDFLESITNPHTKLGKNLKEARNLLNTRYGREVRSGRNINETAKEYAKKGLGTTGSLRDLYNDITSQPKDPASLFEELNENFDFDAMKPILSFLLHSLGTDMKSKGPSISNSELTRLFAETRTMQAILGIYRFFLKRMDLIKKSFAREDFPPPKKITYELLAKLFARFIQERYPSPDKVLRLAYEMDLENELLAQIIVFTQYRDAVRGVSPRLFRSQKHREDTLMAIIETISELDDLLEEEDEEEEEMNAQTNIAPTEEISEVPTEEISETETNDKNEESE